MDEKVIRDIIQTSNIIRQKYNALKLGIVEEKRLLEDSFEPIIKPLNDIKDKIEINTTSPYNRTITLSTKKKNQTRRRSTVSNDKLVHSTPKHDLLSDRTDFTGSQGNRFNRKLAISMDSDASDNITEDIDDADDLDNSTLFTTPTNELTIKHHTQNSMQNIDDINEYLRKKNLGLMATKYFKYFIQNPEKCDSKYGIYKNDSTGEWKVGSSNISIANDKIVVNDKIYNGTNGLYELLFMKIPDIHIYNENDLSAYGSILRDTSAYKKNFDSNGQINGDRSAKYRNIIRNIVGKHYGGIIMKDNKINTDLVYWNDPNELVDRLRLLIASQAAGHNNHNNEILSIIEELRENNLII